MPFRSCESQLNFPAMSPNNSFKPSPCRGVGHVLYATLARVRRPATGRLNSSVRPHRGIFRMSEQSASILEITGVLLFPVGCLLLHERLRRLSSLSLATSVLVLTTWSFWVRASVWDALLVHFVGRQMPSYTIMLTIDTLMIWWAGVSLIATAASITPRPRSAA